MSLTYSNTQFNDDVVETGNSTAMELASDPLQNICDGLEEPKYPPFSHLRPHSVEFTNIFPRSHIEGHATVIELIDSVLNDDAIKNRVGNRPT
jgi:hypothetical protein